MRLLLRVIVLAMLLVGPAWAQSPIPSLPTIGSGGSTYPLLDPATTPEWVWMTQSVSGVNTDFKIDPFRLGSPFVGAVAPATPFAYQLWWDTGTSPVSLLYYNGSSWVALPSASNANFAGIVNSTGTGPTTLGFPNGAATFTFPSSSKTLMATDMSNAIAPGGDLGGLYPSPTVARVNGALLGATSTATGTVLLGVGSSINSTALSGDVSSISNAGAVTLGGVNGVAFGRNPALNSVPVVSAPNVTTYSLIPTASLQSGLITLGTTSIALGSTAQSVTALTLVNPSIKVTLPQPVLYAPGARQPVCVDQQGHVSVGILGRC